MNSRNAGRFRGIDPDPSATPEARKARRESWRPLTFILVNHVLLPRLALDEATRRRRLSPSDRDLIDRAACAPDLPAFVKEAEVPPPPGRGLARLLEETFSQVVPETLQYINQQVKNAIGCRWPRAPRTPSPYRWDERSAIATALLAYNRPPVPETALYQWVRSVSYDYNFAVCFFPALYWHACRHWPFDKAFMPYARHADDAQRRLHAEIQAGLTLEDFDRALIGEGELGQQIAALSPARPSPEDLPSRGGGVDDWVELAYHRQGGMMFPTLPRPPQDVVFDHLDRCEFLERFTLIKLDRAAFADLARGLDLPSWRAWMDAKFRSERFPDAPPHGPERFAHVVAEVRRVAGTMEDDRPHTLESHAARMLTTISAEAVACLLGRGDWTRFLQAADVLGLPDNWRRIAEAIARRSTEEEGGNAR